MFKNDSSCQKQIKISNFPEYNSTINVMWPTFPSNRSPPRSQSLAATAKSDEKPLWRNEDVEKDQEIENPSNGIHKNKVLIINPRHSFCSAFINFHQRASSAQNEREPN